MVKLYEWKKDRVLATCSWILELKKEGKDSDNVEITKVTFDPVNKDQLMMTGRNHGRLWRNQSGAIKPLPKIINLDQSQNYVDNIWTQDGWLILGSSKGKLYFVIEGRQCVAKTSAFGPSTESVSCLYYYHNGFIVGGNNGQISLWEKRDALDEFAKNDLDDSTIQQLFKFDRNLSKLQCYHRN